MKTVIIAVCRKSAAYERAAVMVKTLAALYRDSRIAQRVVEALLDDIDQRVVE